MNNLDQIRTVAKFYRKTAINYIKSHGSYTKLDPESQAFIRGAFNMAVHLARSYDLDFDVDSFRRECGITSLGMPA